MLDYILSVIGFLITLLIWLFSGSPDADATVVGGRERSSPPSPLQIRVGKKYAKLKTEKKTFRQFCNPTTYEIQPQQRFVGDWMTPSDKPKELLMYHGIGAGKTCAAIQIGEKHKRPIIVMPASLIPGFRNELRGSCAGDKYITPAERKALYDLSPKSKDYRRIIAISNDRIDRHYQIFSYNKFMEVYDTVRGDIIICDEVQNISNRGGKYYQSVRDWIESHPRSSVVLMTATPIFDSPAELNNWAELLRINQSIDTPDDVKYFAGKVSRYVGAPPSTYPQTTVKIVKCEMSNHQRHWYSTDLATELSQRGKLTLEEMPNDFYSNTRQRANIAYPRGLTGEAGLRALTTPLIRNHLDSYSCKMAQLMRRLKKRKHSFIFSNYTGAGGIAAITKCMRVYGFKDYFEHGPGPNRYAVWSGDTSDAEREEIRAVFNHENNDNASKISVVVGSPSVRAGVSLLRVRYAHIMETHWNHPYLEQVYGRVDRYCSHKRLPLDQRNVKIYLYVSYAARPDATPENSIDLYMLSIADRKKEVATPWCKRLNEVAVDRLVY